jgi:vitamin B12 transporter
MRIIIYFTLYLIFFVSKAILANENLGEIVVSPNKSILQLDKTGASVLLVEKQQIDRSASTTVSGLLQEFGGFSIATKGNKGTDPSYFNRGLARKYIKVLVDGMDLSDITSTQEEPTYIDNISNFNLDNIEILNGSQGTLYGGDAVGGVVSINSATTQKLGLTEEHFLEGGSYGTFKNSHSLKFLNNDISLTFNLDSERSNGYNSFQDTGLAPLEKDGYYLYGSNFLTNFRITESTEINFRGRFYNQHNDYDNNYSYPGDSLVHYRYDKTRAILFDIVHYNDQINQKFTFQPTYTSRINASGSRYEYDGRKSKFEYLISSDYMLAKNLFGIDYIKKSADMNGKLANQDIYSIFTEFKLEPTINTNLDISGRREYDNNYGNFDTARMQINHRSLERYILRASIGTGYRTPTPYELYSDYGNTNLKPETSLTYDLGFETTFKPLATNFYIGLFETKVEDIITYSSLKYRQTSSNLKSNGLETRIKSKVSDSFSTSLNYTKTNAKENDGDSVTLVPKDKVSLFLNVAPTNNLTLDTSFLFQNKAITCL